MSIYGKRLYQILGDETLPFYMLLLGLPMMFVFFSIAFRMYREKDLSELEVVEMKADYIDTLACMRIVGKSAVGVVKQDKSRPKGYNWYPHKAKASITPSAWIYDDGRPTEYTFEFLYEAVEYRHALQPFTIPAGYQMGFVREYGSKPFVKANALGDFREIRRDQTHWIISVTYSISESAIDSMRSRNFIRTEFAHPKTADNVKTLNLASDFGDFAHVLVWLRNDVEKLQREKKGN